MSHSESSRIDNQGGRDVATDSASQDHSTALAIIPNSSLAEPISISSIDGNTDKVLDILSSMMTPPARDPSFDMTQSQAEEQEPAIIFHDSEENIRKEKEISNPIPLAVVQIDEACTQHKRHHNNQERRKRSHFELLKRPNSAHIDRVKYSPDFYASLDTAVQALSQRAIHLLGILSFFHHANIPQLLFTVAAKSMFAHEDSKMLPRPPEFKDCIQFLKDIICPSGEWKEEELDILVEELQKHSIITIVPTGATTSIRFHPLVHTWARQRLSKEEEVKYQAAVVRLFTSSITIGDDYALYEHLCPHTLHICPELGVLHVNDRVAISRIVGHSRDNTLLLSMWRDIRSDVQSVRGLDHFSTMSQINREVGYATWLNGDRTGSEAIHTANIAANEEMFGKDRLETVWSRGSFARVLRWTGRAAQAEEIEKENLRRLIRTQGLKSLTTARAMQDLAITLSELGRHEDRLPLVAGVVEIRTKLLGRSAQRTIWALENLAQSNEPMESEKIKKEVLELRQKLHGMQSRQSATAMATLASRYFEQKRYKEAKELRQAEWEARKGFQGRYHIDTLNALNSLARVQFELRQYITAEQSYRELWRARQRKHGDMHSQTLVSLHWVARVRFEQARWNDAETLWRQWLEGCRTVHGHQHVETIKALYWLARAYTMQQCYAEAADIWSDRLEKCRQVYGEIHATTLICIGWLAYTRYQLGWFYEAERLRREATEGWKQLNGKAHPDTLTSMESLSGVCFIRKQYEEAAILRKEVLEERIKLDGPRDPKTLKITFLLALTYHEQGRNDEAERLLKDFLEQAKEVYGKSHSDTLAGMKWLGKVHSAQKNYADAEPVQKEYLEACRSKHGSRQFDTLWAIHTLASTYFELGKFENAEGLWKEELEASRSMRNQATLIIRASNDLARLYFSTGKLGEAKVAVEESIRLQRRTLMERAPALVKNIRRLESITAAVEREASTLTEVNLRDIVEDSAAPDPGGDPTFSPPKLQNAVAHIERHYRPFTLRLVFGIYPNHWNMF